MPIFLQPLPWQFREENLVGSLIYQQWELLFFSLEMQVKQLQTRITSFFVVPPLRSLTDVSALGQAFSFGK